MFNFNVVDFRFLHGGFRGRGHDINLIESMPEASMTLGPYVNTPLIGLSPRELSLYTNSLTESLRSDLNRSLLQ